MSDAFDEAVIRLATTAMACGASFAICDRSALAAKLRRAGPTASLGDAMRDDAIQLLEIRPSLAQDIRDALAGESAGA